MLVGCTTIVLCCLVSFVLSFLFCLVSGAKSATGLLEWSDVDSALDAFVIANHTTVYAQSECEERVREREREGGRRRK